MSEPECPAKPTDVAPRQATPSPFVAWLPGVVLLIIGGSMAVDGEMTGAAWLVVPGAALVLIGTVAQGVLWGLDLHKERQG